MRNGAPPQDPNYGATDIQEPKKLIARLGIAVEDRQRSQLFDIVRGLEDLRSKAKEFRSGHRRNDRDVGEVNELESAFHALTEELDAANQLVDDLADQIH